jgi:hypothetical protein
VRILLDQLADSTASAPTRELLPTKLLLRSSTEGSSAARYDGPAPLGRPLPLSR